MGNKLGIYFPNFDLYFNKGDVIEIKVSKDSKKDTFIAKYNYNIVLRKKTISNLNIAKGEIIDIELKILTQLTKPKEIFKNDKIDLLALIPEKNSNGNQIFMSLFNKNAEEWLRLWCCHGRGSCRQIEIKRFVCIKSFGRLLGQLQAEGTKSGKRFRLEFCNKLVQEHRDFISYLEELGFSRAEVICKCDFHPNVEKIINEKIKEFECKIGIPIKYVIKSEGGKGSYGFKTYIGNSLITEIILESLYALRKRLVKKEWGKNLKDLADSFFAKLLTGDGTLDIQIKNREYDFPSTRIKITDGNLNYLRDYATIMEKLGFIPKISKKHISVRSHITFGKMLYLYRIKAFQNTPNWEKLIFIIAKNLEGRRLKTFLRFLDLPDMLIAGKDLIERYHLNPRLANYWLNSKEKEGFLIRVSKGYPIKWRLTKKAEELIDTLDRIREELTELDKVTARNIFQPYIQNSN